MKFYLLLSNTVLKEAAASHILIVFAAAPGTFISTPAIVLFLPLPQLELAAASNQSPITQAAVSHHLWLSEEAASTKVPR